ncbi:accessory gene regulator ArgB-like protein [Paenibacillus roseus]|uniref:accessory gene regulator ArgB-like protein n=1 Tax=Paenibacillus sp. GCM10012307 TaxID=3317343 RepID=UPI0036D2E9E0
MNYIAYSLAVKIKNIVPEHPRSVEVLSYSLSFLLNSFFTSMLTFLISFMTGRVLEAIIVMCGFAFLRQLSGGYHLKSGMLCIVVSTGILTGLSMANLNSRFTVAATIVAAILALVYAPSGIERQTRIPTKYFPLLKISTVAVILTNLFFLSDVLAAAFLFQCLTLIQIRRS